jgi:hypothetical protein
MTFLNPIFDPVFFKKTSLKLITLPAFSKHQDMTKRFKIQNYRSEITVLTKNIQY